jgi:hypothetical protein
MKVHKNSCQVVAGLRSHRPSAGDVYFLRKILQLRAARSFEELLTFNGTTFEDYYSVAVAMGLAEIVNEYYQCMKDSIDLHHAPSDLRNFACMLILDGAHYEEVITPFKSELMADCDNDEEEFKRRLSKVARRFRIPGTIIPVIQTDDIEPQTSPCSILSLSTSQKMVADSIIEAVKAKNGGILFLQGRAGTGKTFTVNAIINELEKDPEISCLVTGSTGIAASQYDGATTLHSLFKLGIDTDQTDPSTGIVTKIGKGTYLARMLEST